MSDKIKNVVLFYDSAKPNPLRWAKAVGEALTSRKIKVRHVSSGDHDVSIPDCDAVIAVGGDGTVLHAARLVAASEIPMLGINAGSLGFLSGLEAGEFGKMVDHFAEAKFRVESRSLLCASVRRRNKAVFSNAVALNDCVIKAVEPRAVSLRAAMDGHFLTEYFGD